jgi:hypothetical protein
MRYQPDPGSNGQLERFMCLLRSSSSVRLLRSVLQAVPLN